MIKSIFAVDYWGGMGYRGTLPWPYHKQDLQHFKELTDGHVVVMGRKTWDDPKMPKPLPNRINYVVTHRPILTHQVRTISGDLKSKLKEVEALHPDKIVWVIGGPEILMETKDLVTETHVTHFKNQYRSDVQIDAFKYLKSYRLTSVTPDLDALCCWITYKNLDITQTS